jgi:hypothetical protein
MSRVAPVLSAVTLVIVVAAELTAQTPTHVPEPSPPRVDPVAVPEQGYAVRVPAGAFGIDLSADVERQVQASVADDHTVTDWITGSDPAQITRLIEGLEEKRDRGWQVVVVSAEAMCEYSVVAETPADFDTFVVDLYAGLLNNEDFTQVEPPVFLQLNGGLAVSFAATQQYGPLRQVGYAGVREDETYWVICRGPAEPDAPWRSFVAALEWPEGT